MRHSQGIRWDLLLYPIGNYALYASTTSPEKALRAVEPLPPKLRDSIAWQEDVFVFGPPVAELRPRRRLRLLSRGDVPGAAGQARGSFPQREMENVYLKALAGLKPDLRPRPGAGWDLFTIGFYRLEALRRERRHSRSGPEAAARRPIRGREPDQAVLETLISSHHDALAVGIK
jgi:hypothetical protein